MLFVRFFKMNKAMLERNRIFGKEICNCWSILFVIRNETLLAERFTPMWLESKFFVIITIIIFAATY